MCDVESGCIYTEDTDRHTTTTSSPFMPFDTIHEHRTYDIISTKEKKNVNKITKKKLCSSQAPLDTKNTLF
jgi:hypothetical protein